MRVLVTGVNGQLGHDVLFELINRQFDVIGSDVSIGFSYDLNANECKVPYYQMDITDETNVISKIQDINPDAIIHCAAWTAVDLAEDDDKKELVYAVNVIGTKNIAKASRIVGAKMLYLSTDYVFDGKGDKPWSPNENRFAPLNYYGQTKLEGEYAVSTILNRYFIVRIAWVFGINGRNFVKTMISVGETHDVVRVVNDQIGTPTYTFDLAVLLVDMIQTEKYGYYHVTNEGGYISWYDFCLEIYKQYGLNTKVVPVSTAEYGMSKANRPHNSRLDKSKLVEMGFTLLPDWNDALGRFINTYRTFLSQ